MAGTLQALVTVHLERLGGGVFGPHRVHWVCLCVRSRCSLEERGAYKAYLWSPSNTRPLLCGLRGTRGLFLFLGSPLSLSERSLLWAESFPFCSHSQARGLAALTGSGMVRSSAFVFLGHPCAECTLPLTGDLGTLF